MDGPSGRVTTPTAAVGAAGGAETGNRSAARPLLVLVTGLQGTGKSAVAQVAAEALGAPVLAHDWAMSGLRPYPGIQAALNAMDPPGHRVVGWSVLWALARAQLRHHRSVVLDGVARMPEIAGCRDLADQEDARMVVILTQCTDLGIHRSRVEGRRRSIPDWYELEWAQVERTRARWEPLTGVDLVVEADEPWAENAERVRSHLEARRARSDQDRERGSPDGLSIGPSHPRWWRRRR